MSTARETPSADLLIDALNRAHAAARELATRDVVAAGLYVYRMVEEGAACWAPEWKPSAESVADDAERRPWPRLRAAVEAVRFEERRAGLLSRIDELEKAYSISRQHPEGAGSARFLEAFLHDLCDDAIALGSPDPALKVNEMLDFAFTMLARVRYGPGGQGASKRPTVADIEWRKTARDFFVGHGRAMTRTGPMTATVLRFASRRYRIVPVELGGRSLTDLAAERGAVAYTNGGYYIFGESEEESDESVGFLVADGRVERPPILQRACLLQDDQGRVAVERVGPKGIAIRIRDWEIRARALNARKLSPGNIVFYNRVFGEMTPTAHFTMSVSSGRVTRIARDGAMPIPVNGLAVAMHLGGAGVEVPVREGDAVDYVAPPVRELGPIWAAIAGGPMFVDRARSSLDFAHEDFGPNLPPAGIHTGTFAVHALAPRLACGLTDNHEVVIVAVAGRDFKRSVGIDLDRLGRFMLEIGCVKAFALDGGGSLRCVVKDGSPAETIDGGAHARRERNGLLIVPA